MPWSRRAVLKTALGGSVVFLSGCGSDGIEYSVGDDSTGGSPTPSDRRSTPGGSETLPGDVERPEATPTDTQRAQDSPENNPQLDRDTDRIFDEIEWFATEYRIVLHQALGRAREIHQMLVDLHDSPTLSAHDIDRIKDRTGEYYEFLQENFEPHFPTSSVQDIVGRSNLYIASVERFADRGDIDQMKAELSKLVGHYATLSEKNNLQQTFPGFPIHAPLAEYMTSDSYSRSTPLLFVVTHPNLDYTTAVRADASWNVRTKYVTLSDQDLRDYERKRAALFEPVDNSTGRTERMFLDVHLQQGGSRHVPIYVQRYEDSRTARSAYGSLLNSPVFVEENVSIGGTQWNQGYYFQELNFKYDPVQDRYVVYDADGTVLYEEERTEEKNDRQLATKSGYVIVDRRGSVIYDGDGSVSQPTAKVRTPDEQGDIVYSYLTRIGKYVVAAYPSLTAWERQSGSELDPLRNTWLA